MGKFIIFLCLVFVLCFSDDCWSWEYVNDERERKLIFLEEKKRKETRGDFFCLSHNDLNAWKISLMGL